MTDQDEKLSILLDDYSAEGDTAAAVDAAVADVNLQYRMRRYQMIGEVMRHELPRAIDPDFHNSVMATVRAEAAPADANRALPAETVATSWFDRVWLRPVAGLALAAGVAVVTVALLGPAGPDDTTVAKAPEVELPVTLGTPPAVPASLGTSWTVDQQNMQLQQKLNAYLVNHTEYSNSVQGLIPQARVAGFDSPQQ